MSYGLIYCVTNTVNGKKYVGQTTRSVEERWKEHKYNYGIYKYPFYKALKKYNPESFEVEVLCECYSKEDLDDKEVFYIDHLNSLVPNGYNCTTGGNNGTRSEETCKRISESLKGIFSGENHPLYGKKHSIESLRKMSNAQRGKVASKLTLEKMSKSQMGKTLSLEHRKKISESNTGKRHSKETIEKLSKLHVGKKLSEETKKKISESTRSENHHMYGKTHSEETIKKISKTYTLVSPCGEIVSITNMRKFCRENNENLDPSAMCGVYHGRVRQHKGWNRYKGEQV